MRNSNAGVLYSPQPPNESLLLYRRDRDLQNVLLNYVKSGISSGDLVVYLAGMRTIEQVERMMQENGIDVEFLRKKDLIITSYDNVFLSNGKASVSTALENLGEILDAAGPNRRVRIATESNWYIQADLFKLGTVAEKSHVLFPRNVSIVCSYNIDDMLDYTRIYHLAKLVEKHSHAMLKVNRINASRIEIYSYLRALAVTLIRSMGLGISTPFQNTPLSSMLNGLDRQDALEIEKEMEKRLRETLRI